MSSTSLETVADLRHIYPDPGAGGQAKVAVIVDVREAYIHCAKALRRGAVWRPEDWPDRSTMPTIACMLRDHTGLAVEPADIEASLERSYEQTMWEPGGRD